MKIHKPIFIIGSHRSGTRLLYNLLAFNPELCWISTITDAFPSFPQIAITHKVLDLPLIGTQIKHYMLRFMLDTIPRHLLLSPREGSHIYGDYCGFVDDRKTTERDRTRVLEKRFKHIILTHLRMTGKSRFLTKQPPNVQRIRLLNAMFPDAYFLHIIRDGRAVANSLLQAYWWPEMQLWWLNGMRPSEWNRRQRDPVELCAMNWQQTIEEVFRNKKLLGDRYVEIRYEALTHDVRASLSSILTRCELRIEPSYLSLLPVKLQSRNTNWKDDLTPSQQKLVGTALQSMLNRLGYT